MKELNKTGAVLIEGRGLCCSPLLLVCLKCCTFDLSLPKLLVLQGRGSDYWNGGGSCLCWLCSQVVSSCTSHRKPCWAEYLSSADVDLNVLTARVCTLGWWALSNTSLLMISFLFCHTQVLLTPINTLITLFCNPPLPDTTCALLNNKKYTTSTDGVLKFPFEVPHVAATFWKFNLLVNDIAGRRDRLHKAEL